MLESSEAQGSFTVTPMRVARAAADGQLDAKLGALIGCLHKALRMASDMPSFWLSLEHKVREFEALGYPKRALKAAWRRMEERSGDWRWPETAVLLDEATD